jgi:hypothetical protein
VASRSWIVAGIGVVVLVGAAAYGALIYPTQAARAAVDRVIATLPQGWTASYSSLDYNLFTGRLVLGDAELRGTSGIDRVKELVLTGFEEAPANGSGFKLHDATLTRIDSGSGSGEVTIGRVVSTEIAVEAGINKLFAGVSTGEGLLSLPHLMSAKHVVMSDVRNPSKPEDFALERLTVDDFGNGSIGALTMERLSGTAPQTRYKAAKIAFTGIDVDALRATFDPAAYADGQSAVRRELMLLRGIDWQGTQITSDEIDMHVDAVQLTGFRGRPFIKPPTDANARDPRFVIDVMTALAFDSYALRGVHLNHLKEHGTLSLAAFELGHYAGGRLDAAKLGAFEAAFQQPQDMKFGFGTLELRGLDVGRWLAIIAERGMEAALGETNGNIEVPYLALTEFTFGNSKRQFGRIATISGEGTYQDGYRTASKAALKGLEIPLADLPLPPEQAAIVRQTRLDRLALDLDMASHFERATRHAVIDAFNCNLAGLGTLSMTGSLARYDPSEFTPALMEQALQSVALERLELRYRDASLVAKAIAIAAAQAGVPAEQFRTGLIQQIEQTGQQMAAGPAGPDAAKAAHQLAVFLAQPGTLTVTLAPAKPVSMADIAGLAPPQRMPAIGLTVTAE